MLRFLLSICFLPLLLLLGGCAKRAEYASDEYYAYDAPVVTLDIEEAGGRSYRAQGARFSSAPAPAPSMDMAFEDDGLADMEMEGGGDGNAQQAPDEPSPDDDADDGRMIYYNGYLHLRVVRAEEAAHGLAAVGVGF